MARTSGGLAAATANTLAAAFNDLLGQSTDAQDAISGTGAQIPAATIFLMRIPLPASTVVTNVLLNIVTIGVTLTNSFAAIFRSSGAVVGQSADQSTIWGSGGSTGNKTTALVGGPFTLTPLAANDFIWTAFYIGTLVTSPFFAGGGVSPTANIGTTVARSRAGTIGQANTASLASIAPAGITPTTTVTWSGIS